MPKTKIPLFWCMVLWVGDGKKWDPIVIGGVNLI